MGSVLQESMSQQDEQLVTRKTRHSAEVSTYCTAAAHSQHLRSSFVQHLVHILDSGHPEHAQPGTGSHPAAPWMLGCHWFDDPAKKLLQVKNTTATPMLPNIPVYHV